jgi:hypothetical protein
MRSKTIRQAKEKQLAAKCKMQKCGIDLADEVERLNSVLTDIGDFAHCKSTGPEIPGALWEVRSMAYFS